MYTNILLSKLKSFTSISNHSNPSFQKIFHFIYIKQIILFLLQTTPFLPHHSFSPFSYANQPLRFIHHFTISVLYNYLLFSHLHSFIPNPSYLFYSLISLIMNKNIQKKSRIHLIKCQSGFTMKTSGVNFVPTRFSVLTFG